MSQTASSRRHPDRWSLDSYFTAFGSPDYTAFKAALQSELEECLSSLMTREDISAPDVAMLESLGSRLGHLSSFLGCLSADDATNEAVKADEAWLSMLGATMTKIASTVQSRLAALDATASATLLADPSLEGAGHAVNRLREEGRHLMPAPLEALAADLNVDGLHAWGRLYDTLTGKLTFPMTFPDGSIQTIPMAQRRALMADPNREIREAAFRDGQVPWDTHADTFGAALNGIAGTRLGLYTRRGITHFLQTPLFDGALSRETLDAMMTAIHAESSLPHRALRAAARLQGTPALHFFDLEAPQIAAPEGLSVSWDDACDIVRRSFHAAYPALGEYFDSMLENRWIEAQPRPGKRPGAFCTGSHFTGEQRVYMTYHDTIHDVVTLAHEVGHAWHSHVLKDRRPFAREYPMTLAETASNFGEMILLDGLQRDASSSPELLDYLLDQEMNRAHSYLVNIPMRYEFERAFYEERASWEISVSRLRALMNAAQRELYGDTLLPDGSDPFFWASKMHFFITGISFYNFPYVFGYLLSQALFARFKAEGASFLPRYEAFLGATGSADCETVVRQTLGEDITRPEFWATAIRALAPAVERYEALSAR